MVLKTKEEAKANFEASISYIPARYTAGVDKADWLGPAKSDAAEKNFGDGVSKAVTNKTRQKAIAAMSNEDWKNGAKNKGAPVIGERIRAALDEWSSEWGPMYDQVVSKVPTLKPATIDWRANINNRLVPVVEVWKKAAGKA